MLPEDYAAAEQKHAEELDFVMFPAADQSGGWPTFSPAAAGSR
jgi:hypothetical protein